jgi:hypothetical protein
MTISCVQPVGVNAGPTGLGAMWRPSWHVYLFATLALEISRASEAKRISQASEAKRISQASEAKRISQASEAKRISQASGAQRIRAIDSERSAAHPGISSSGSFAVGERSAGS